MGMFHMLMTYTQILLKRFDDAGLQDAHIQCAVVGSVSMAFRGKCYNRGIRLYKLFYEALLRIVINRLVEEFVEKKECCLIEITK